MTEVLGMVEALFFSLSLPLVILIVGMVVIRSSAGPAWPASLSATSPD
jgi:hypothetical protein